MKMGRIKLHEGHLNFLFLSHIYYDQTLLSLLFDREW
jgi:hypothetical protein